MNLGVNNYFENDPGLQGLTLNSIQEEPESKVDPIVPWYGPLLSNPYIPVITPFFNHQENGAPIP